MSENTKIEWADSTWSPWRGCTKVSEGCAHCYAETLAKRNPAVLGSWGKGAPRVMNKNWNTPRQWNRQAELRARLWTEKCPSVSPRPLIFPSLCDWLDDEVPIQWLAEFLILIAETPYLDWLLLSKRIDLFYERVYDASLLISKIPGRQNPWISSNLDSWDYGCYLPNIWLGVSAENQDRAAERVPKLLRIPAEVRWVSLEPLLGPVDLRHLDCEGQGDPDFFQIDCISGKHTDMGRPCPDVPKLDWLVIGGESGNGARPCNLNWIRSLVRQGDAGNVPVFVKQLGAFPVASSVSKAGTPYACDIRFQDKNGGSPDEWPEDLRVRRMPRRL